MLLGVVVLFGLVSFPGCHLFMYLFIYLFIYDSQKVFNQ